MDHIALNEVESTQNIGTCIMTQAQAVRYLKKPLHYYFKEFDII